ALLRSVGLLSSPRLSLQCSSGRRSASSTATAAAARCPGRSSDRTGIATSAGAGRAAARLPTATAAAAAVHRAAVLPATAAAATATAAVCGPAAEAAAGAAETAAGAAVRSAAAAAAAAAGRSSAAAEIRLPGCAGRLPADPVQVVRVRADWGWLPDWRSPLAAPPSGALSRRRQHCHREPGGSIPVLRPGSEHRAAPSVAVAVQPVCQLRSDRPAVAHLPPGRLSARALRVRVRWSQSRLQTAAATAVRSALRGTVVAWFGRSRCDCGGAGCEQQRGSGSASSSLARPWIR
ncbi:hypothetical protein PENTCL1PPCAC_9367, partial [Pristionchus entomophagus]